MNWTPWRRNKANDNVPAEVQEYYQSERRERVGVAWLLAVGTLLGTLAIVIGLFFGGRWAWRQITGNDSTQRPATTQNQDQNQNQGRDGQGNGGATDQNATERGADDFNANTGTPQSGSGTGSQPAAPATPPGSETPPALVNTGPGDETGL